MANVIIFGVSANAELAHYYLTHDSGHEVAAFCVDADYLPAEGTFQRLPVIAFEEIGEHCPPETYAFLAPLSAADMNRARARVYQRIRTAGYEMISYVSSRATVLTRDIGDNCFILEDNTVQPFVHIGDDVVLWSGNHIGHHGVIEDHVFFSSHVVMSGRCRIGHHSYLGVNATLRDGLTLGEGSFIAMGACLTRDTEAWTAYAGSPARSMRRKSTDIDIYHAVD